MISYPVTNDIAMQIFALELEQPGQGLDTFSRMLPRTYDSLMPTVEEAGLESPFSQDRIVSSLACLESVLDSVKKF